MKHTGRTITAYFIFHIFCLEVQLLLSVVYIEVIQSLIQKIQTVLNTLDTVRTNTQEKIIHFLQSLWLIINKIQLLERQQTTVDNYINSVKIFSLSAQWIFLSNSFINRRVLASSSSVNLIANADLTPRKKKKMKLFSLEVEIAYNTAFIIAFS